MNPTISYLICATNRSGSFLLCEALKNTGIAGNPEEYFWRGDEPFWKDRWRVSDYGDYLMKAIEQGTSLNGVFGAKIMWGYFDDFIGKLRQIPAYERIDLPILLPQIFPDLHYIQIIRRDKVRQAISFWRAIETNVWAWTTDEKQAPEKEPSFNYEAIQNLELEIITHEAAWKNYFEMCQIEPYVVIYEEFVARYEETARDVLQFLEIPFPSDLKFAERKMKKQSDDLTEKWVEAYCQRQETDEKKS
jgi:trehalose 2-sulfotransferase